MEVLFCTIASKYRLHQCVAMYHSLKRCLAEAALVVLAVDEECRKVLVALQLQGVIVISAEQLENNELKELKEQRNESEYCWTLKPILLLYLYEYYKDIKIFTYLDSDLLFFDNPMRLFKGSKNWSVLLTTHKVNRRANGGFVAFKRGSRSYEALKWWKEECLKWCYFCNDNGRFADQGYLDLMRTRFKGVTYLDMPGANLATWNYFNSDLELKDGNIYIGRHRLVFYHFSGLRLKKMAGSTALYGAEAPCLICGSYVKALRAAISEIEGVDKEITESFYMGL